MRAAEIIDMIPEEMLDFFASETKADYRVQKLKGSVLFKLLIYSLLTTRNSSLRVLEGVFHSYRFKAVSGIDNEATTRFTSIRDRIATIEPTYFKKLFEFCSERFNAQLQDEVGGSQKSKRSLLRFDSTMIALSAGLMDIGMKVGRNTDKKQIKRTIGYNGLLPTSAQVFTEQKHLSEDICLYEAIKSATVSKDDIVVFDRGVSKRSSFTDFSSRGIQFITRIKTSAAYQLAEGQKNTDEQQEPLRTDTLDIEQDSRVYLFAEKHKRTEASFRLIKAKTLEDGEPIWFLTNIGKDQMSAAEVSELYRRRWDIEVFFKFLKQELDLEHLPVRTVNGIEVVLYAKLIAAMLLTAYKVFNNLKGYKLVKLRFADELEEDLIKTVVEICGGDPDKMHHTISKSSFVH